MEPVRPDEKWIEAFRLGYECARERAALCCDSQAKPGTYSPSQTPESVAGNCATLIRSYMPTAFGDRQAWLQQSEDERKRAAAASLVTSGDRDGQAA